MQLRKDFDQDLYNEHNSSGCQKGARLLSLMGFTNVVIKEEDFTYDLDALDPDGNPVKIEIEKRANRNATQEAERETGIEDSPELRERGGGDV